MNARTAVFVSVIVLTAACTASGADWVKRLVPDWNQPYWHGLNGPNGGPVGGPPGPWQAWCTPTAAANVLGYWEDGKGVKTSDGVAYPGSGTQWPNWPAWQDYQANGSGTRGVLSPNSADDIGWYMDTNRMGDPALGNGPHTGTFLKDVSWPGLGLNLFFSDRGQAATGFRPRTQGIGYADAGLSKLTQAQAWNRIVHEIDSDRPIMVAFMHWVLIDPIGTGSDASPEGALGWEYRDFVPGGGPDPWGNGEEWNDYDFSGTARGHYVTVVGYITANSPGDILGNTDWVIAHDNVGQTARNVAVPFTTGPWLANTAVTGYTNAPYGFGEPETVDEASADTGWHVSLALDGLDKPHASYEDWTNHRVRYATKSGGNWITETVDSQNARVWGTSIAVTAGCTPRIAYSGAPDFVQHKDLFYAVKSGGWSIQTAFDATTEHTAWPALVLNADNNPRISHRRGDYELWLSQNNGFGWVGGHTCIDDDCYNFSVQNTSMAIDHNGDLYVAYSDEIQDAGYWVQRLKYATNACGGWSNHVMEDFTVPNHYSVGQYTSIDWFANRQVTISHHAMSTSDLRIAQTPDGCNAPGTWNKELVHDSSAQGSTVVRYDSAGRPVIAYWGGCGGSPYHTCLKLARYTGTDWTTQNVYERTGTGSASLWCAMDLDACNRPHIAFRDPDSKAVRYIVARHRGDLDGDGCLTTDDRDLLIAVILDPDAATEEERLAADCNGDGELNGKDIQAFLDLLLS